MPAASSARASTAAAADGWPLRRHGRLASGLILFGYIATHLANHALGSISIATAERALRVAILVWHSGPGTTLLYGAAAIHIGLAFVAVYERRTFRMPPLELLRIAMGFGMPALLIGHAVSTRLAFAAGGHPADYAHVVWMLQHTGRQGLQIALLVPGWLHGCLGIRCAFGRCDWFRRLRVVLLAVALALPLLSALGFFAMSNEVAVLAIDPAWIARTVDAATEHERARLDALHDRLLLAYFTAIFIVLLARQVRAFVESRSDRALVSCRVPLAEAVSPPSHRPRDSQE